jgi:CDP-diacylglycerol--glycerol-3-phosphate 3-phosphatidyltransferase
LAVWPYLLSVTCDDANDVFTATRACCVQSCRVASRRKLDTKPMISTYALKQRFQSYLRPLVDRLAQTNISANTVTLCTMTASCLLGLLLFFSEQETLFLLLPLWMFVRMALNAIDGMLAQEHGQKSRIGAYLNELTDVISDAALYVPFVAVPPFGWPSVGAVIFLSTLCEFAGALGLSIGTCRRYDGPMGKSDRAVVFGVLGLVYGMAGQLPSWAFWIMPAMAILLLITAFNRVRSGLADL